MIIYVKELEEILTINMVKILVKDDVLVKKFNSVAEVKKDGGGGRSNIVIVSKLDSSLEELNSLKVNILVYEDYFEKIAKNIIQEIEYNYDYYFLKDALLTAKNDFFRTIITGLSYGLLGIDANMLYKEINLSLSSQDLYYSYRGILEVCRENKNIKNIVLCCNYYYFYFDMSKSINIDNILRISKVYYPIYKDMYNCPLLPAKQNILFESNIFDINRICDIQTKGMYVENYFNENKHRKDNIVITWEDKDKLWKDLNEEERYQAGKKRALMHNKSSKYNVTLDENTQIFKELVTFCKNKGINLVIVVAPGSKSYCENLWPGFKESFYNVLNETDGIIHVIDLFDSEMFNDQNFIDADHLGDSGARKMTKIVLNVLQEIENKGN